MTAIAFIGLGNMGNPMAANLVKAGHAVTGFDLVAENLERAAETGVSIADSAAGAVAEADIVITMLPAGKHVLAVYEDIATGAKPGTLFIDCSTIDVETAQAMHRAATEIGRFMLDAPVSGGTKGADAGTLTFMCGGDPAVFERPDEFDLDRHNAHQHLGFAAGQHHCLGSHLAIAEGRIALVELVAALPGLRLDTARPSSLLGSEFRQPDHLWVVWDTVGG